MITLGIIGVVAAMTLPTLIKKHEEKVLITQAKKVYAEFFNGLKLYSAKNDCADELCVFNLDKTSDEVNLDYLSILQGAAFCDTKSKNTSRCKNYSIKARKKLNNGYGQTGYGDSISKPFIIFKSGAIVKVVQYDACPRASEGNVRDENGNFILNEDGSLKKVPITNYNCALIYMDSNGVKGPNQFGADVFRSDVLSTNKISTDSGLKKLFSEGKLEYEPYKIGVEY